MLHPFPPCLGAVGLFMALFRYATDGDTAARWLMGIDSMDAFEQQEQVVDLGAGNGVLGIGALLLGAKRATFVELDLAACEALEEALEHHDLLPRAQVLQTDVAQLPALEAPLVLMNPPWGQQRRSADRPFLEASVSISSQVVHVMHSAKALHLEPWASEQGWEALRWLEMDFPLPKRYAHHTKQRASTRAAVWRLEKRRLRRERLRSSVYS